MLVGIIVFLLTAVIIVPLFRRLRPGTILAYLSGGIIFGPWGFGLIHDVENVFEFSELEKLGSL